MGMFDRFNGTANSTLKGLGDALTRTKDANFLPAFASAMALMVGADGTIAPEEIDGVMDFVNNDPTLAAWNPAVRSKAFEEALEAASRGIMRQASLFGKIAALKGKAEAETLCQLVYALAHTDGDFAESEQTMFKRICKAVDKNAEDYMF
jgi:tellurite resistance protein